MEFYLELVQSHRVSVVVPISIYRLVLFLSHDSRVPVVVRNQINKWGFAKDEFADNNNWPVQIYVREALRMLGEFVMTENEVQGRSKVLHFIGMGSCAMDSHNVRRYIMAEGYMQNERAIGITPKTPYQIDMRSIMPKKEAGFNIRIAFSV